MYTGAPPDHEIPAENYPVVIIQESGKKVYVVQAYAYTKYLGRLNLEFDKQGSLVEIDGSPILLDATIPQDLDVLKLLEYYRPGIAALENEIVGSTKVLLDASCRLRECNLGNFMTDAFVDWYSMKTESSNTPIGFFLSGGFNKVTVSQNQIVRNLTMEDVTTILRFNNEVQVVEVSGKVLLEALEHSVHRYGDGKERGEFLQMSGVQVVYNMTKPSGQRVFDAKVLNRKFDVPVYEKINKTQTFKVVLHSFLAKGGDGFEMFKDKPIERFETTDFEIFLYYLKKKSPISPEIEGRIVIKNFV